jgi:D-beta-D-heptose 7-phosphate kinase/D-beta-D-heptose 1-phosphate adenosyltransferase
MKIDFSKARVLVIGDVMLDRYFFGKVSRISPEAPVPVARVVKTSDTLGGAGNVANNLSHLKTNVCLAGPIGRDDNGALFINRCNTNNIEFLPIYSSSPTIVKTRVFGEHQQIVRVDFEEDLSIDTQELEKVKIVILQKIEWATIIILSDYGKGFCSAEMCRSIIDQARKLKKHIIVDPKGTNWIKYTGASIITPNVKELCDVLGTTIKNSDDAIEKAAPDIRNKFNLEYLLVTRSENGMSLVSDKQNYHVPTEAREVFDVSGAGDTVVATLAAAFASGYDITTSTLLANKAAGIVCSKVGTAPIEIEELQEVLSTPSNIKLFSYDKLTKKLEQSRAKGHKIVFTNGCFDILHRGHIHLFREAKKLGAILVVAINSDQSMQNNTNHNNLINNQEDRAHLLSSLVEIDYITIFDEPTPIKLIEAIKPDIIVKGGNFSIDQILGKEHAEKAVVIPFLAGYSAEEIALKLKNKCIGNS